MDASPGDNLGMAQDALQTTEAARRALLSLPALL